MFSAELLARFEGQTRQFCRVLVADTFNGTGGSNPSRSANQSVLFTYNMEMAEKRRAAGSAAAGVYTLLVSSKGYG